MEDKKSLIVAGLKPVLGDANNKVKQAVCQLITALADHGYLLSDGGQMMIEFLLKQLCLPMENAVFTGEIVFVQLAQISLGCLEILDF